VLEKQVLALSLFVLMLNKKLKNSHYKVLLNREQRILSFAIDALRIYFV
tara:strand:- start:630 stop:776 length:147 start_codon:yes stop_codon:yes gene_type:complete